MEFSLDPPKVLQFGIFFFNGEDRAVEDRIKNGFGTMSVVGESC